jgi:transposase InsO family protein
MAAPLKNRVIDRYAVLSIVFSKQAMGLSLREAIVETSKLEFYSTAGQSMRLSLRTIYRWSLAFKSAGLSGLTPKSRLKEISSRVLPSSFTDFMVNEKKIDTDASIPDIILRAEIINIIKQGQVNRCTAWRAARNLNLPIFSDKRPKDEDMRRFAHANRMVMLLCDGKHFRAGPKKCKRMVYLYLDDCSRKVLLAVVGESETARLFLRGLFAVIEKVGLMDNCYLDRGPGFIAKMGFTICARIGVGLIHGRARYPQGHGKIERFNQTCMNALLRSIAKDPTIDPDCKALEHRINHYISQMYNLRPHEGIEGLSPENKWSSDPRPLRMPCDMKILESHFIISFQRTVSRDNVVMIKNTGFEMPTGYAGMRVEVFDHILEGRLTVLHELKHVTLHPVDLEANARAERRRRVEKERPPPPGPAKTAAQRLYDRDHKTIVTSGGDYYEKD